MSRSNRSKKKHGKSSWLSEDSDEESAARTRPFSFEDIMLRRRNKDSLENTKDPAPGCSSEKIADHFESARINQRDKSSSIGMEKHASEKLVNVNSKKKLESTLVKVDYLSEGNDRAKYILDTKSSAGLKNDGRIVKEKTGKEMHGYRKNDWIDDNSGHKAGNKHSKDSVPKDSYAEVVRPKSERKNDWIDDNSGHKAGNKHSKDSVTKDSYAEVVRPKSERKIKKMTHIEEDESPNQYITEKRHDKDRDNRWKSNKRISNDYEEVPEKKHYRESAKDKQAEVRAKYDRETKRKYRNGDDETQDRNTQRKQDHLKHHNLHVHERKERREKVKSNYEELTTKRRRSRSREREDRRRSPSFSPREQKRTHQDVERKELSLSLKDSSQKKNSEVRVSANGSSNHHHRHGGSTSGLGGYSPRKRKSEAAVKTPSPSKHSREKKHAGWDLPPAGTNNPSTSVVSSTFQFSHSTALPNTHNVASSSSLDLSLVLKPLPVSFLNETSTGKNTSIDSVQLTQATRPMRRLYLENLPVSTSERAVMDCFNNLLFSTGVNHVQQALPCISCILHKDKGQALVEFLTADYASAALSFDGSTLFGSAVKIRRPKDYVEVATGELERSVDAAVTVSEDVIDSPHKIFIGGISSHISSKMLMEIAGAFGSLKAFHFVTEINKGSRAFVEYVDHSVTIKACAGLNGMKLGGEILTVVQAMPDASLLPENAGKPPSYGIPEHAKPLLRKPTQVLEIKNVFAADSISSLSDMAIEEILEDVRLECARFGTIKSINVVKHNTDKNLAIKSEECEVINKVDAKEDSSFYEKATYPKSEETNGVEFHDDKDLEEDIVDKGTRVCVENNEVLDNKPCQEHLVSDTSVEDVNSKNVPCSIIQECPEEQNTSNDGPECHNKRVGNDIDVDIGNKMVGVHAESKSTDAAFQEGYSEDDTSCKLGGPVKGIDEEDDAYSHVFEQGSVLVEYGRAEACCSAAHCLHGRSFDGRMVTVEYVSLSLYRKRFTK